MEKRDNMHEWMGNASRDGEIPRKTLTETLVGDTAADEKCL